MSFLAERDMAQAALAYEGGDHGPAFPPVAARIRAARQALGSRSRSSPRLTAFKRRGSSTSSWTTRRSSTSSVWPLCRVSLRHSDCRSSRCSSASSRCGPFVLSPTWTSSRPSSGEPASRAWPVSRPRSGGISSGPTRPEPSRRPEPQRTIRAVPDNRVGLAWSSRRHQPVSRPTSASSRRRERVMLSPDAPERRSSATRSKYSSERPPIDVGTVTV